MQSKCVPTTKYRYKVHYLLTESSTIEYRSPKGLYFEFFFNKTDMLSYDFDLVQVLRALISNSLQVDDNEKPNIYFNRLI